VGERLTALAIDPQDESMLYAWNGKGLFKSADAGASVTIEQFRFGRAAGERGGGVEL
jgi:hypothetical protein